MKWLRFISFIVFVAHLAHQSHADIVQPDDVITIGSLCVGLDCIDGENFGFDTLRLKENNLRIHFEDTSANPGFPTNDWRITINDIGAGGQNYFSIDDVSASTVPFKIDANAPSNAVLIESTTGNVGLGIADPALDLHILNGNTPAIRLEQDGTGGFSPQTWDVAGNEANFFVRDLTNAQLPFRIQPGAPSNALTVNNDGNVGVGVGFGSTVPLHVRRETSNAQIFVEDAQTTEASRVLAVLQNKGNTFMNFCNSAIAPNSCKTWQIGHMTEPELCENEASCDVFFKIDDLSTGPIEFRVESGGTIHIAGDVVVQGTQINVPDYVFKSGYKLMPLYELETFIKENFHLPEIPSEKEIQKEGLGLKDMQMLLLKKIEELTLYTIEQQKQIDHLREQIRQQKN